MVDNKIEPFQSIISVIMDTTDPLMGDTVSFSFDVADTEVLPESEVVMSSEEEESGIICQLMDIREPLLKLRSVLEQKLGCDLSDHDFWLQDQQPLEETMTLVEQCVQGEGLVQINVEIKVTLIVVCHVTWSTFFAG